MNAEWWQSVVIAAVSLSVVAALITQRVIHRIDTERRRLQAERSARLAGRIQELHESVEESVGEPEDWWPEIDRQWDDLLQYARKTTGEGEGERRESGDWTWFRLPPAGVAALLAGLFSLLGVLLAAFLNRALSEPDCLGFIDRLLEIRARAASLEAAEEVVRVVAWGAFDTCGAAADIISKLG